MLKKESGKELGKVGSVRLWSVILLLVVLFAGASEAAIALKPRVEAETGKIVGDESYVLLGKYVHRLNTWNGVQETEATPVLWRVMEVNETQAALLSHHLVDAKAYGAYNTWPDSTLMKWLNDASAGFLTGFSDREQAAMITPSPDGLPDTKVTLPTGEVDNSGGTWHVWPYSGDIKTWFGDNDFQNNKGAGVKTYTNARKASFKGSSEAWNYWTRSPVARITNAAWNVNGGGTIGFDEVHTEYVGVRPVFLLDLRYFTFKSASVFDAQVPAGTAGNPYFLYSFAVASEEWLPEASINGDKLTLSFSNSPMPDHPNVFHVYTNAPDTDNLKTAFALSDGTSVTALVFKGTSIEMTLSKTYAHNETAPTVSYLGNTVADGIGFVNEGLVPTTLKGFGDRPIANATPNP